MPVPGEADIPRKIPSTGQSHTDPESIRGRGPRTVMDPLCKQAALRQVFLPRFPLGKSVNDPAVPTGRSHSQRPSRLFFVTCCFSLDACLS